MSSYPPAPPPGSGAGRSGGFGAGASGPGGSRPGGPGAGGPERPGEPATAPVCPRHPDQVSYVRCQRCGRPACPACQRPAPVGVHCVDCARAAQRGARPQRTRLGGRARSRPYVTLTLIGLCVAMFLLDFVDGGASRQAFIFSPLAASVEPWRMLTSAFLHAGVVHLAFNMFALWITGPFLERFLGAWRFLALYLIAALGGSVAVLVFTPYAQWQWGTVGASGAVFGLFAAAALLLRRVGGDYRQIVFVILINVVISFTVPNISWQAHLGGMVVGALIALLYLYLPKKWRTAGAVLGLAGIVAGLVGITAGVYAAAGLWF